MFNCLFTRLQWDWSVTWPCALQTMLLWGSRGPSPDWSSCWSEHTKTHRDAPAWEAHSSSLWWVTHTAQTGRVFRIWCWPLCLWLGGSSHGGDCGGLHRSTSHPGQRCPQQNSHQRTQHNSTLCTGKKLNTPAQENSFKLGWGILRKVKKKFKKWNVLFCVLYF